jgi:hypothetical protein
MLYVVDSLVVVLLLKMLSQNVHGVDDGAAYVVVLLLKILRLLLLSLTMRFLLFMHLSMLLIDDAVAEAHFDDAAITIAVHDVGDASVAIVVAVHDNDDADALAA